jgi:hypothetical protein
MLLVVLLHACAAYMLRPVPGLLWPVQEPPAPEDRFAWLCDGLFHLARVIAVPLATVVAGFVAARALERHSRWEFLRDRWKRLGRPLLICIPLVLVPMYLIWAWGWIKRGWAAPEHILHVRFGPAVQPNLYGFAHLWYLQYMLLYVLLLAGAWPWITRVRTSRAGQRAINILSHSLVAPALLAGLLTLILYLWPTSVLRFHNGFVPETGQFVKHLLLLLAGVLMAISTSRMPDQARATLADRTRWWWILTPIALVSTGVLLGTLHAGLRPVDHDLLLVAASAAGTIAAGVWAILGLLARVMRLVTQATASTRWLAESSLWVYLVHLIPQGLCVVLLYEASVPGPLKLLLVLLAGLVVPLAAWRWIRTTRLGELLGGPGPSTRAAARPKAV